MKTPSKISGLTFTRQAGGRLPVPAAAGLLRTGSLTRSCAAGKTGGLVRADVLLTTIHLPTRETYHATGNWQNRRFAGPYRLHLDGSLHGHPGRRVQGQPPELAG